MYTLIAMVVGMAVTWFKKIIWTASRTYDREKNTVGNEYDAWTTEGILEYYWGEHIHLGYYTEKERLADYRKKNFIEAKYDFIDRMADFGKVVDMKPQSILDVGCGIGGTSRYLAKKFGPNTTVTGITLSQEQQKRATVLAEERGIPNAKFKVIVKLYIYISH
jgi:MPBQ/MSBQ methyltransferase